VRIGERHAEQIVAEEQASTMQQLTDQRCATAMETRYDQLVTQGRPVYL
jgi:hypothetical protein